MSEDLNNILVYLGMNKRSAFEKRTKSTIMSYSKQEKEIDAYLSTLSREGYIRSYFHPSIGLAWDSLKIDSDQKIFYSVTERGMKFLKKGGYN